MGNPDSHYTRIVEQYHRYRPRYPSELLSWLRATCGLVPAHVIADIGAGTGQFTELLLEHGNRVYAVEPNVAMRRAAEQQLGTYSTFTAVDATAEATSLPDRSVHLIVVGNAFHWFDHDQARREFERILAPVGWVVLLWNLERNNGSPFAQAFEQFWQTHIDSAARFNERVRPGYLDAFFGAAALNEHRLDNVQLCGLEALKGLVASFRKAPQPGTSRYPAMLADLEALFHHYQIDGTVTLAYDTAIVYGRLLH